MTNFFTRLLSGHRPQAPRRNSDPHAAAAALLVEAALIDGVYANLESDTIADIMVSSFNLDATTVDALMKQAEDLAVKATDTHALTRQVKALDEAGRTKVIEALYRVSLADGETCKFEDAFVRHVASLLHIDDVSRAHARKRAEAT